MLKKVLIAAGGSGGHIFPAVALARSIQTKAPDVEIRFVGSAKSLDRRIFEKEGFKYYMLSGNKLPYKASPALVLFAVRLFFDTIRSFFTIISYRPDVVVGFGGYVSFPVIFMANILRIPAVIHEQNVVPGRANRISFKFAKKIALSFDETRKFLTDRENEKAVVTGNPIRREILKDDKRMGVSRFGLNDKKFTILVIGGSQGAHFLNRVFLKAMGIFDEKTRRAMQVIHLTGARDYEYVLTKYQQLGGLEHRVHSFIDRMEEAYSASDLVVTRSGASAIFEVAFYARPMILVPYPHAMSHQAENAHVFSKKGAAIEVEEKSLTPEVFKGVISGLCSNPTRLKKLSEEARRLSVPEASDNFAMEIFKIGKE